MTGQLAANPSRFPPLLGAEFIEPPRARVFGIPRRITALLHRALGKLLVCGSRWKQTSLCFGNELESNRGKIIEKARFLP
jgi:hypothetical protein